MSDNMKLWLLEQNPDLDCETNPWNGHYDLQCSCVVRAESESDARAIAEITSGEENFHSGKKVWLEEYYTTCVELLPDGHAGLIIQDFLSS